MERIILKSNSGAISCNNKRIYTDKDKSEIGEKTRHNIIEFWIRIYPKYYKYLDDGAILEIWYDNKGIILDKGNNKLLKNGYIADSWTDEKREEINYERAMEILRLRNERGYCNKDLMSRVENELEKENNNGGATDYYTLPKDANTLQDLIEHRNMNGSVKDIFKACYRLGIKTEDELRDANKMAYYSLREVGRISGRKDYITIAKELMGSQAIEGKDCESFH